MPPIIETPALEQITRLEAERARQEAYYQCPWWVVNRDDAGLLAYLKRIVREIRHEDPDLEEDWLATATPEQIEDQLQYLADYQG
jgi:hypothetical protein